MDRKDVEAWIAPIVDAADKAIGKPLYHHSDKLE
jgi:hypothetical protein